MAIDFKTRPPVKLLDQYQVNVPSDNSFRSWCRLKQSIYRASQGWKCRNEQTGAARKLGNYLCDVDAEAGRNFLTDSIFADARKRLAEPEPLEVIETTRLHYNM